MHVPVIFVAVIFAFFAVGTEFKIFFIRYAILQSDQPVLCKFRIAQVYFRTRENNMALP